jgi:hypothetical protein
VTDKTALVVLYSDLHTNSIVGLNPDPFRREHGSEWRPGKGGRAKLRAWKEFWQLMADKKAEHDAHCYALAVGDLGDMNRASAYELISVHEPDVLLAIADVGESMTQVADTIFILRGTAFHNTGNGKLEELYARDIDAIPDAQTASWWVVKAEFGGVVFEVTHHPTTSSRLPWAQNIAVSRAASIVAARYQKYGKVSEMPNVCVWAHVHYKAEGKEMGIHGFFLPPWQTTGEFGHRLGAGALPGEVGGLWFLCKDGEYTWGWETWTPEKKQTWHNTT